MSKASYFEEHTKITLSYAARRKMAYALFAFAGLLTLKLLIDLTASM